MTPYHAKYFAYELTKRNSSDSLQKFATSLMDAQVDLNPHQVEAALFAFRSPLSTGAILADEVGLGKTIEAGLVISQKWAERKRKILIIVPSNLRKQWNQELLDKFFIPSVILERKSFNNEIKKGKLNPFDQQEIIICSYQFARSEEAYVKLISWDLVVIDEAHRLRNVYKPSNKIAQSIKNSLEGAPKILLTATPLQNSLLELFGLVSFVDEYAFGDLKSFRSQYSRIDNNTAYDELKTRLKPICIRTLRRQVYEYIRYTNRIPITQEFFPQEDEQKLYELVSEYLQSERLYALPQSQRQLMTLILRKLLASSTYAIAGTLEALTKRLDAMVENHTPPEEELNAELENDFEALDEISDEWTEDPEVSISPNEIYTVEQISEIKEEAARLKEFFALAKSIQKNSKGEVLLTALKRGFHEAEILGADRKALIFTESTRTQNYLFELLNKSDYKDKVILFNGSNNDQLSKKIYQLWHLKHKGTDKISGSKTADIRSALIEYFRDDAEIMIATEAAAEGVNLQFCSLVVNYDLPWNPQRIEQRIGRCHRYGQKYDVVVVNFLNRKNAADIRVFELLAEKFKLFEGVFGASDEVLGTIESGVDFEKRIAKIYQNCRTPDEINSAFDELQKSLENEIDTTLTNTRQTLLENFDQEVIEKLRIRDSESKDYLNVYQNWLWKITKYYLEPYAKFNNTDFSFNLEKNPFPDERLNLGFYRMGKSIDDANLYRIGHTLAQSIIQKCKTDSTPIAEITFDYSNSPLIKIAVLEKLIGKSGWMKLISLTICSFECEEIMLFVGITDDTLPIEADQCKRMFSLPALTVKVIEENTLKKEELNSITKNHRTELIKLLEEKNKKYFVEESDKLNKWADDLISSAEDDIKKTKLLIRELNRQIRNSSSPQEILGFQKELQDLEGKKRRQRQRIFEVEDQIEKKRNEMIDILQKKMSQNVSEQELFTIKWKIM